jgi:hypothetical protein
MTDTKTNHFFRCIHCLTPNPHLYRRLHAGSIKNACSTVGSSNNNNIKLSDCVKCHQVVDSYCEREWLLVVLDLVLLRRAAFRSVLWNRNVVQWQQKGDVGTAWTTNGYTCSTNTSMMLQLLEYCVLSSFLQAIVNMKTFKTIDAIDRFEEMTLKPTRLVLTTIRFLAQLVILITSSYFMLRNQLKSYPSSPDGSGNILHNDQLFPRLLLAWVLPTTFYLLTLFLHTWETTSTGDATNQLISLILVTVYQGLAVQAVVDLCIWDATAASPTTDAAKTSKNAKSNTAVWLWTMVVALLCRGLFGLLLSALFGNDTI